MHIFCSKSTQRDKRANVECECQVVSATAKNMANHHLPLITPQTPPPLIKYMFVERSVAEKA